MPNVNQAAGHPPLPTANGPLVLTVRDDADGPQRQVTLHLVYPGGARSNLNAASGLMLVLHNWGGTGFRGAPDPAALAERFNVVAIGVDYYQSGDQDHSRPYDFGLLQAMDALRALWHVFHGLEAAAVAFDRARLYATGGSGGGNVSLMANKLAPRTFACIVDLSGMASLTDEIAFGLPGGSILNARYSPDPRSPAYLSPAAREIRDTGHPAHLTRMRQLGNACQVVVVHGEDDASCPAADKRRVVNAMRAAGLDVTARFIASRDVDGRLLCDSGHALGDRTGLLLHFASAFLDPASPRHRRLAHPCDFERRATIVYPVTGGAYGVDFSADAPALAFRP